MNARESRGHATRRKFLRFPRTSFESRACVHLSPNRVTESLSGLRAWGVLFPVTSTAGIVDFSSGVLEHEVITILFKMATGGASTQVTEEDATELQFPKGLLSYTLLQVTNKVLKKSNPSLSDRASFF